MTDSMSSPSSSLTHRLQPVVELLHKQQLETELSHRQQHATSIIENLLERQHRAALHRELDKLDSADIAHLLTTLPPEERLLIWPVLNNEVGADVLVEVNDALLEFLLAETDNERLLALLKCLSTEELAEIAEFIPEPVLIDAKAFLAANERNWLEDTLSYPEGTVGNLMGRENVHVRGHNTVEETIHHIRRLESLPAQTDKVFVLNEHQQVVGVVPLQDLLRKPVDAAINTIMDPDVITFSVHDRAEDASAAFERYDLVSAPVIDHRRRLVGRLTVESIMDYLREASSRHALAKEGLSADTDLLGPIFRGARERWPWLCLNLFTAFIASRFISLFSDTIEQLVALAALMPIVASVGGNSGNQTAALIIRALAREEITKSNQRFIIRKELLISSLNGLIWGAVMGLFAWLLYGNWLLGMVMLAAVTLNLLIAAIIGISVPLVLARMHKDPAMGASVVLTFATDSMGFFLFLGLATVFLI